MSEPDPRPLPEAPPRRAPEAGPRARVVRVEFGRAGPAPAPAARPAGRPGTRPRAYRPLFAAPGAACLAPLGPFGPLIAPQLAAPDRLLPLHRLACRVQVYEVVGPARAAALVARIRAEGRLRVALAVLSAELAGRLGRPELFVAPPPLQVPPGWLRPAERLFSLTVDSDPTAAPAAAAAGGVAPARRAIPERYHAPGAAGRDRREVAAELAGEDFTIRPLRALARLLRARLGSRGRLARWRERLQGRELDEQLWGVRPPEGGLRLGAVRSWARRALADAGYDAAMLAEWELFWRGKGV